MNNIDEFEVKEWKLQELKDRKIWIPYMCDAAFVLTSVFKSIGYDAGVLPRSDDSLLSLGRKYTDGEQCLPSIITTEDILKRVFSSDFQEDKEAFFQGKSQGPCRFGRYYMNQLLILHELGKDNVPIFTLDNRNSYGGLGTEAKMFAWNGMVAQAMLERTLHFTRPFEINKGEAEKVYKKGLDDVCRFIEKGLKGNKITKKLKILFDTHKSELVEKLEEAKDEFYDIEQTEESKPVIFVTGEIFVRASSVANQDLVDKIEKLGGVALLEPPTAFFDYIHEKRLMDYKKGMRYSFLDNFLKFLKTKLDTSVARRDERHIAEIFHFENLPHDPFSDVVLERGSKYVHPSYEGEAILTLGGSDFFADYVDGIVNTMPFTCMPGTNVISKTSELRKNKNNIPFLNLAYDGNFDPHREEQLEIFMYQVKEKISTSK